jgi:hypothetical protein
MLQVPVHRLVRRMRFFIPRRCVPGRCRRAVERLDVLPGRSTLATGEALHAVVLRGAVLLGRNGALLSAEAEHLLEALHPEHDSGRGVGPRLVDVDLGLWLGLQRRRALLCRATPGYILVIPWATGAWSSLWSCCAGRRGGWRRLLGQRFWVVRYRTSPGVVAAAYVRIDVGVRRRRGVPVRVVGRHAGDGRVHGAARLEAGVIRRRAGSALQDLADRLPRYDSTAYRRTLRWSHSSADRWPLRWSVVVAGVHIAVWVRTGSRHRASAHRRALRRAVIITRMLFAGQVRPIAAWRRRRHRSCRRRALDVAGDGRVGPAGHDRRRTARHRPGRTRREWTSLALHDLWPGRERTAGRRTRRWDRHVGRAFADRKPCACAGCGWPAAVLFGRFFVPDLVCGTPRPVFLRRAR